MAIGDSKEDLSAYSREDLVYKAKLAEQAERCARDRRAMRCDRSIDAIDWNDERSREGLSLEPSSSAVGWMDLSVLYRRLDDDDDDDDDDARVVRSFRFDGWSATKATTIERRTNGFSTSRGLGWITSGPLREDDVLTSGLGARWWLCERRGVEWDACDEMRARSLVDRARTRDGTRWTRARNARAVD